MEQTQKNVAAAAEQRTGMTAALVDALFDAGTFSEIGTYVKGKSAAAIGQAYESVITGYGAVDGRPVFAFIQDADAANGVMTAAQAGKISRLYEMAIKSHAPMVGIFSGSGASIAEGTELLSGYGEMMRMVQRAKAKIPQIAVIDGVCAGTSAVLASMLDLSVINEEKGSLFVGAPFLLREKEKGTAFGTPAFCSERGLVSCSAENSTACMATVRRLLSYLPSDTAEGNVICPTADDINAPAMVDLGADTASIIADILDAGSFLAVNAAYAPSMITGLGILNDRVVGVIANNKNEDGGRIHAKGARKAADFIAFCNRMRLPVLTLVDSEGTAVTPCDEKNDLAGALGVLAGAYADASVPLVSAIVGKAYGAAFALMGSRALGADVVYAADTALIGTLSPEAAVEFTKKEQLSAGADRAALVKEYAEEVMNPYAAASCGDIDRVLDANELRPRIAAAFEMLALKEGTV